MTNELIIQIDNINKGDSSYCWVNVEIGKTRVGKARIKRAHGKIIIKNINVFPEFERQGIAKQVVNYFKRTATEIYADRVRGSAKGFWKRMGFSECQDGNYRWVPNRK
ncbi:MAG: GNAT family N-acetyltransferase [Deltaproteobacteria bacterium]|nr:GNAT family N-acetyltransferase [Deltaproteobacteria bacterium]MBW2053153.1 GNAT family N-acetyltransferase [Deltaproteobacteria bacterium]MBW2141604.1 GNAT family N-acetyltransferase [Deltaproteobacteria bacterium]MBW2324147.1 GNAT family N-acetyltransferase [Deltaproteobacteria bacterium]